MKVLLPHPDGTDEGRDEVAVDIERDARESRVSAVGDLEVRDIEEDTPHLRRRQVTLPLGEGLLVHAPHSDEFALGVGHCHHLFW